jgi:hypothetical protein
MFLILPSSGRHIIEDPVSERIAYAPVLGLRAVSLCFSFCLRTAANHTKACVRTDSLCSFVRPSGGKFMFLILPSSGKLIIEDHVSERIAYAPLLSLRAVSLCFSFCLRAGSLL